MHGHNVREETVRKTLESWSSTLENMGIKNYYV